MVLGTPVQTRGRAGISDFTGKICPSVLGAGYRGAEVGLLLPKLPDDLRVIIGRVAYHRDIGDEATSAWSTSIMGQRFFGSAMSGPRPGWFAAIFQAISG